jgi:hypothetical protein
MRVIQDDLWLCTDCLFVAVNGDYSGLDYYYTPEESAKKRAAIDTGLSKLGTNLSSDFDSETGEGINEFSNTPCACCGAGLAGSRHRFAILGN